jgi:hypothetical protein
MEWVLINRPKVPQMPQNLSAKIVCPSPKVWDFDEKRLHWASVDRGQRYIFYVSFSNIVCKITNVQGKSAHFKTMKEWHLHLLALN